MHGSAAVVSHHNPDQLEIPAVETLTPREMEVMLLVFRGLTQNQIGSHLGISPRTCEIYRGNALKRLGVSNSILAMRQFLRAGYLGKILEEA